jgi:hypothetical protein
VAKNKAKQKDDWVEVENDDWEEIPANPSQARARSRMETAAGAVSQSGTLGYTPQIVGGMAALADRFLPPVIDPASGERIPRTSYLKARDQTSKDIEEAARDNPGTSLVAGVGASIANPLSRVSSFGRIPNPLGIGKGVGGTAARSGTQAALYNPGDKEGEIDPIQLGQRAAQGTVGAGGGALGSLLSQNVQRGANAARVKSRLQKTGFQQEANETLRDAVSKMSKNYVEPRMAQIENELAGNTVTFRPDILKDTDTNRLKKSLNWQLVKNYNTPAQAPDPYSVVMSAERANRLRRLMDAKTKYSQTGALADPKFRDSAEAQKSAADILRRKIGEAVPSTRPLFEESSYALGLMGELANKSKNPQSVFTASGDMASRLVDIDAMAGTNLKGYGQGLIDAGGIMDSAPGMQELVSQSKIPGIKPLRAGFSEMSRGIDWATDRGALEAMIKEIMEAKRMATSGGSQ